MGNQEWALVPVKKKEEVIYNLQISQKIMGIAKNLLLISFFLGMTTALIAWLSPDKISAVAEAEKRVKTEIQIWPEVSNLPDLPPDGEPSIANKEPVTKNEAAPIIPEEQSAQQYINKYWKLAQTEQKKYGIPASITLAQGLIESRAGNSKLARNNNNHFGMKCVSKNCKKGHCTNFTDDTHKDFFLKFSTVWESYRRHSLLLSNERYKPLHTYGTDYKKWAYGLKAKGYATDRTYAEKLIGVIKRYNLHKYD